MTVEIWCKEQSAPIIRENVKNAYTKGDLYCVMDEDGNVWKVPLANIFYIYEGA